jgi:hypothetical protein
MRFAAFLKWPGRFVSGKSKGKRQKSKGKNEESD